MADDEDELDALDKLQAWVDEEINMHDFDAEDARAVMGYIEVLKQSISDTNHTQ